MAHTVGGLVSSCTIADLPSAATCKCVLPTSTSPKGRMLAELLVTPVLPHAVTPRHSAAKASRGRALSLPTPQDLFGSRPTSVVRYICRDQAGRSADRQTVTPPVAKSATAATAMMAAVSHPTNLARLPIT